MMDADGNVVSAAEVVALALDADGGLPTVVRRSDEAGMSRLRTQVRRAAKRIDVECEVRVLDAESMLIRAIPKTFGDYRVRRAMDVPDGI